MVVGVNDRPINVTDFGFPKDLGFTTADMFAAGHRYSTAINALGLVNRTADVVLLDGRYRIACGLYLLHYDVKFLLVHDWGRPGGMSGPAYEEVLLKYYDLVNERVGLGYLLKITWYFSNQVVRKA